MVASWLRSQEELQNSGLLPVDMTSRLGFRPYEVQRRRPPQDSSDSTQHSTRRGFRGVEPDFHTTRHQDSFAQHRDHTGRGSRGHGRVRNGSRGQYFVEDQRGSAQDFTPQNGFTAEKVSCRSGFCGTFCQHQDEPSQGLWI